MSETITPPPQTDLEGTTESTDTTVQPPSATPHTPQSPPSLLSDIPGSGTLVPIDEIEALNSRERNMRIFEEIVENIRTIGLKKPITVTERTPE